MTQSGHEQRQRYRIIAGLILMAFFLYRIDLFYGLITRFFVIITALIVGLLIALLLNIPLRALERLLPFPPHRPLMRKLKRGICLSMSVLALVLVVFLLMLFILPEVVRAVESLINRLPELISQLESWLLGLNINLRELVGLGPTNPENVREVVQRGYNFLIGGLSYSSNVVFSAAQLLINLVIGLVFAVTLLFSKERVQAQVSRLLRAFLPAKFAERTDYVLETTVDSYTRFLGGQCLQALVSGVLVWLTMMVFGFPYALLVALLTFVFAFIPIFGPYIAGFMGALLVYTASPERTILFLLVYLIVQQLEGSLVYPRILSNAVEIPTIWVLMAVTVGGGIMGIPGMLLIVPLVAVAYRLLKEATNRRLKAKEQAAANG